MTGWWLEAEKVKGRQEKSIVGRKWKRVKYRVALDAEWV
jgi:hypothetical protein